ncbi:MAG: hypothetical protein ACREBH_01365 [Candidatus Micrarchaeaceae archaeon]
MDFAQIIAILSTLVVFVVSALLAAFLTKLYIDDRKNISYLVWAAALRFFSISVILEILFSFGVYSDFLVKIYLFAAAMPLLVFSAGHIQFIRSEKAKQAYYYCISALAFILLGALFVSNISNPITNYVVHANLPLLALIPASIIAASSSIVLFYIGIKEYMSRKDLKILAIIPGALAFWGANFYSFSYSPILLYYFEILGIMLIWLGIAGLSPKRKSKSKGSQRL